MNELHLLRQRKQDFSVGEFEKVEIHGGFLSIGIFFHERHKKHERIKNVRDVRMVRGRFSGFLTLIPNTIYERFHAQKEK